MSIIALFCLSSSMKKSALSNCTRDFVERPSQMKGQFRLEIELVPSTVWQSSLHQLLPRSVWHKIKQQLYAEEGRKCYICGSWEGRFSAHEFWMYDDSKHIQRLIAVHHLCNLCHKIKHVGFWCHTADGRARLETEGLSREDLDAHFCRVNDCTEEDFSKHEDQAFAVWKERSTHEWTQDFGKYSRFLR